MPRGYGAAKTDREAVDGHAKGSGGQQVTQFVDGHQQTYDEQKWPDV